MPSESPQDRGRQWERDLVQMVGGTLQVGSGNRVFAKLDVDGGDILWSAKYTDAMSWSVSQSDFDEARSAVFGPQAIKPDLTTIIASKLGDGTMLATMDLIELIGWVREPPQLIQSSKQDTLRETAKVPPFLR